MVELLPAHLTRELLEAGVCVHVVVQVASGLEGRAAHLTHVRSVERSMGKLYSISKCVGANKWNHIT